MKTYISVLRGINVSGQKIIKMEDLRDLYSTLGFTGIESYIQSGNVIFQTGPARTPELANMIRQEISVKYGFDVEVLVKEIKEFGQVIKNNPFTREGDREVSFLHVTFLSGKPLQENIVNLEASDYGQDEFKIVEDTVYLYCPGGYGKTKLSNNFFESKLKVKATTRNWKTINELFRMASGRS